MNPKPCVFIGCSSERKTIAGYVQELLSDCADAYPFHMGVFKPGDVTIERLEKEVERADFAVMLFLADDKGKVRGKRRNLVRDNVLIEFGLFAGALGHERCYIIRDATTEVPSDLSGITVAKCPPAQPGHEMAALNPACIAIEERIRHLKLRPKQGREAIEAHWRVQQFCERVTGDWFTEITNEDRDKIGLIHIEFNPLTQSLKWEGRSYDKDGEQRAEWHTDTTSVKPDECRVIYSWAGDRKKRDLDADPYDPYDGFGVVTFHSTRGQIEPLNVAHSWYYNTNRIWSRDEKKIHTEKMHTEWARASEAEANAMNGDKTQRRALVCRKLDESARGQSKTAASSEHGRRKSR